MIHYLPHPLPPYPEGHATRAAVLREGLGTETVCTGDPIPDAATILVDTYPLGRSGELTDILPRIPRTVLLARALSEPEPGYPFDLSIAPGPYEGTPGVGPLVPVASETERDIEVLVVGTGFGKAWAARADALTDAGFDVTLLLHTPWRTKARRVKGSGEGFMARARVVVGGAGTGTLYGALWAGCSYVVAREANREQAQRWRLAQAAGEPVQDGTMDIVAAVRQALFIKPEPPRENGVAELREMLGV